MVIKDLTIAEIDSFYVAFAILMREGYGQFPQELREFFLTHDYLKENFANWLTRNIRKILISVEADGRVSGFLIGDHTYGGVAFVSWIGVIPEFRNQGIASQLMKLYEMYVRSKSAHLIELYTYEAMKQFYEKRGFTEIGRREHGFYGQLNLIMNKEIGEWSIAKLPS